MVCLSRRGDAAKTETKGVKYKSGLPFTESERERCIHVREGVLRAKLIRKLSAPKGHYDRKPTPADKALTRRIMGERD